ncbi:MAG: hypothetical protein ABR953_03790 [Candidatus Acidiferrales bacterium]|jgi:hypothetical protein
MKTNHAGYSAKLRVFLGILLAACFLATAAHADSLFEGKFTLTNEVHWGKAVLGPGAYTLVLNQSPRTIIVRDASGKAVAQEPVQPGYNTDNDDSQLLITVRGNQRAVYSVRLAGLGEVFQEAHPFAESGRAAEEARNAEAIPVEVAKK